MKDLIAASADAREIGALASRALERRFGRMPHDGAGDRDIRSHAREFGDAICYGILLHLGSDANVRDFAKALGDCPGAPDAIRMAGTAHGRAWVETFLDTFNPEDLFEDAKFIRRVASFYMDGDIEAARQAGEAWLSLDNGPVSPADKRRAQEKAMSGFDSAMGEIAVFLRVDADGVFMDVGDGKNWLTADGVASPGMGMDEAKRILREFAMPGKPAAGPKA